MLKRLMSLRGKSRSRSPGANKRRRRKEHKIKEELKPKLIKEEESTQQQLDSQDDLDQDLILPALDDEIEEKRIRVDWTAGVPSPPGKPSIELSTTRLLDPEMVDESITDEINITWDVPEDDGGFPITGYRVEMLDIQSGCWVEITFIEGYEPRCTLSNILYGIVYRFRIVAINDAGPSDPGPASEAVVVDMPGVQIAPYFVQSLTDTIALEHEKVDFRVQVLGTPKPSLQWFKDDFEICNCDRIELRDEGEGGLIVIKGARLSDSGVIKCVATNPLGKVVTSANLSVEAPPQLELPEHYTDGLVFRQDEVIRIKIPFIAQPPPKVVWFFEEEPITPCGDELQVETTDSYTCLKIETAKRWHCGEFRVYAENENGEDACSVLVTVTAPPSPPGRPVVVDISETQCSLRWPCSDDDGGAEVKHYILEYFRDAWNVWLKAKTTKECQATIQDLIPGSRYMFRVKAENSYGLSDASESSDAFDVVGIAASNERISEAAPGESVQAKRNAMAVSKEGIWMSGEQEDILDRFLRIDDYKELKLPSFDSDGIPSIASVEESDNTSEFLGEPSKFQKIFGDRDKDQIETEEDSEVSDIEFKGDDNDQNDSFESASSSSLIPEDKRKFMTDFEQNLEAMIVEANQQPQTFERSRTLKPRTKSPSVHSNSDSIVSVVEASMNVPTISVTSPEMTKAEIEHRQTNSLEKNQLEKNDVRNNPDVQELRKQLETIDYCKKPLELAKPETDEEDESPLPVPPVAPSRRKSRDLNNDNESPRDLSPVKPQRSRGSLTSTLETADVSAKRYEEILRKSSSSSSLTEANLKSASTQEDQHLASPHRLIHQASRESEGAPLKVTTIDLDGLDGEEEEPRQRPGLRNGRAGSSGKSEQPFSLTRRSLSRERPAFLKGQNSNNNNNNKTTSPKIHDSWTKDKKFSDEPAKKRFEPKPIEVSVDPFTSRRKDEQDACGFKLRLPDTFPGWFLITYAYSVVILLILVIANLNPDGKLFIQFTAFWSLILYFVLDEVEPGSRGYAVSTVDPIETMVGSFIKKRTR